MIQFGENLLDMIREVRGEDLCTVVVPLGAKDEETEERLTIASVNNGKDYIEDAEAIALYGRIVKVIEYDDVTLPENLMRKGQSVLNSQRLLSVCITLTAVDLHLLNVDIDLWKQEVAGIKEFYAKFGEKLPAELVHQLSVLEGNLN